MPYVPPHLRDGYTHVAPKPVDYSGRVHWPTNVNTHRESDVVESNIRYSPRHITAVSKPVIKVKTHMTPVARSILPKHYTRSARKHKPSKKSKTRRH